MLEVQSSSPLSSCKQRVSQLSPSPLNGAHVNASFHTLTRLVWSRMASTGEASRRRVSRVAPIADEQVGDEADVVVHVDRDGHVEETLSQDTLSLASNDTQTLLTPLTSENIGLLRPVSNLEAEESSDDDEENNLDNEETNLDDDTSIDLIDVSDLKSSLLQAVQSKLQLTEQLRAAKTLLDKEAAQVAKLRSELMDARRQHSSELSLSEARIKSLARENELLKHQLKKYVGAVQRLKESNNNNDEEGEKKRQPDCDTKEDNVRRSKYVDYHYEASEYEKKLIQVSEMHGELLEFNEHLQHLVQLKESMMVRMREELIQLRGPLPIDFSRDTSDASSDALSIISSVTTNTTTTTTNTNPPLLHIWIPSVFLGGSVTTRNKNKHHVYQVYFRIANEEWNIYRRYSHFFALHQQLCRQDSRVSGFDFPPKKTLGRRSEKLVEDRRRRLQSYLRQVVNLMVQTNPSLSAKPDKESVLLLLPFFGENYVVNTKDNAKNSDSTAFKRSTSSRNNTDIHEQLAF